MNGNPCEEELESIKQTLILLRDFFERLLAERGFSLHLDVKKFINESIVVRIATTLEEFRYKQDVNKNFYDNLEPSIWRKICVGAVIYFRDLIIHHEGKYKIYNDLFSEISNSDISSEKKQRKLNDIKSLQWKEKSLPKFYQYLQDNSETIRPKLNKGLSKDEYLSQVGQPQPNDNLNLHWGIVLLMLIEGCIDYVRANPKP